MSCNIAHFRENDVMIKFFLDLTSKEDKDLSNEPIISIPTDNKLLAEAMIDVGEIMDNVCAYIARRTNEVIYSLDMDLTNTLSDKFESPLKTAINRVNTYILSIKKFQGYISLDFSISFRRNKSPMTDMDGVHVCVKIRQFDQPHACTPVEVDMVWANHFYNREKDAWILNSGLSEL